MTTSAQQLLDTTGSFLKETQEHSKNTTDSLKKVKNRSVELMRQSAVRQTE